MKKLIIVLFITAFILVLGVGGVPSIYAQSSQGDEEFTLEEITVTAEKRAENVQKIPISITAVSGADIRDQAIDDIESTLTNMAGVVLNLTTPAGAGVYIRGIGTNVNTSTADPSVQMNLDGVYVGKAEIGFNSVYDVERVEVLRGPQGTMYGRNAIGGAVNLLTKRPADVFEANVNLRIGNYNLKHIDAAINLPISEKIAARVAVMNEERASYFKPEGDSSDKFAIRARLSYKPTDNLSFLLTSEMSYDRSLDRPMVPQAGSAGNLPTFNPMGSFTKPDVNADGIADDFYDADLAETPDLDGDGWPDGDGIPDIIQTGWIKPSGADEWTNDAWHTDAPNRDYKFKLYSLEMVWDLPFMQFTLFPAFNDNYRDFSIRNVMFGSSIEDPWAYGDTPLTAEAPTQENQKSYEVRFQNPEGSSIQWLAGYFWMSNEIVNATEPRDPTTYGDDDWHFVNYNQPLKSYAYFGQATYPVTERFRLTAGVRGSTDDRERQYRYANANLPVGNQFAPSGGLYDSGKLTYKDKASKTTYKGGLEFDLGEDSMMYAQYSTGFKQGGLNSDIPPSTFEPEYLVSYTIGSKNRFMNNRFQLNGEAYYYDYQGFQIQTGKVYTSNISGGMMMDFMYVVNAEDATLYGLETEMDWLVTNKDHLSFTGTYSHSEYGSTIIPPNPMVGSPELNLKGNQMSNNPTWTFTLGWEHTWTMENGDSISGRAFTRWSDDYYATVEIYIPGTLQKRYHQTELNMYFNPASQRWSAGVWVKNLENEPVVLRVMPIYRKFIAEPRTVGLNFTLKY